MLKRLFNKICNAQLRFKNYHSQLYPAEPNRRKRCRRLLYSLFSVYFLAKFFFLQSLEMKRANGWEDEQKLLHNGFFIFPFLFTNFKIQRVIKMMILMILLLQLMIIIVTIIVLILI